MNRLSELTRPALPGWQYALLAACYIAVAGNLRLLNDISPAATGSLAVPGTALLLLAGVQAILILLFGTRRLLKPLVLAFLLLTAVASYFDRSLGVIFDTEMIRNVVDTIRERNSAEAMELVTIPLLTYVVVFAAPLVAFTLWVRVRPDRWFENIRNRAVTIVAVMCLLTVAIGPVFKDVSFFWRENRDLQVHAMPFFPILSAKRLAKQLLATSHRQFHDFEGQVAQSSEPHKPVLGVLVVGETARADHFSLNGYNRQTNHWLAEDGVESFGAMTACGTSTAYSVPCMFSLDSSDDYDPDDAPYEYNVLDVLAKAGIDVSWIDANSGCKAVCRRVYTVDLNGEDNNSGDHHVFDEDLVPYLEGVGAAGSTDVLLVMHMLGSHGPSYSERYPRNFALFEPACTNPAPQECTQQEVVNAYDNTIAYTDYVLHRLIEALRQRSDEYDTFLVYVSDHGESLGENGIYLHGWPNAIAPHEQKSVPMITWFSDRFLSDHHLTHTAIESRAAREVSHDVVSHSLLGLFSVNASVYDAALDIFRPSDGIRDESPPSAGT
jgi:lipid A ethanolaminephosphotransferase